VHRAASEGFEPADYSLVGVLDTNTSMFRADDSRARKAVAAMEAEGFEYAMVHPHGQCDHCGNRLRYVAVMLHRPSDGLVEIGINCLGNRFGATKAEVKRMMAEAKAAREAHAKLDSFRAACDENPALAYATYLTNMIVAAPEGAFTEFQTGMLSKIVSQSRSYGSLAPWHTNRVEQLIGEMEETLTRELARLEKVKAERSARVDAFVGTLGEKKHQFTGVVRFALKLADNGFGARRMILIDTPEGTVKWTSGIDKAFELDRDDAVAFTATVKAHEVYNGDKQTVVLRPKFA
jgi:hypothetical protein